MAAQRALLSTVGTDARPSAATHNIGSAEAQKFAAYTKMMISSNKVAATSVNKVAATSVMTNQDKIKQLKDFQELVEEITKRILWLKQYAAEPNEAPELVQELEKSIDKALSKVGLTQEAAPAASVGEAPTDLPEAGYTGWSLDVRVATVEAAAVPIADSGEADESKVASGSYAGQTAARRGSESSAAGSHQDNQSPTNKTITLLKETLATRQGRIGTVWGWREGWGGEPKKRLELVKYISEYERSVKEKPRATTAPRKNLYYALEWYLKHPANTYDPNKKTRKAQNMQTLEAIRRKLHSRLKLSANDPMPYPKVGERLSVFINRMLFNPTPQRATNAEFPPPRPNGELPRKPPQHGPYEEAKAPIKQRVTLQETIAKQFPAAFAAEPTPVSRPHLGTNQLINLLARGPENTTPADYIAGVKCSEGVKQKIQQLPAASQARVLEAVEYAARYFVREEKKRGTRVRETLPGSLGLEYYEINAKKPYDPHCEPIWHALSASIEKSRRARLPLATVLTAQGDDSMLPDAMERRIASVPCATTKLDTSVQSHINLAVEAAVLAVETHLGQLANRPSRKPNYMINPTTMMAYARPKLIEAFDSGVEAVAAQTGEAKPRGVQKAVMTKVYAALVPLVVELETAATAAAAAADEWEPLPCDKEEEGHVIKQRQGKFEQSLNAGISELEAGGADRDDPAARAENGEGWLFWLSSVFNGENAPGSDVGL